MPLYNENGEPVSQFVHGTTLLADTSDRTVMFYAPPNKATPLRWDKGGDSKYWVEFLRNALIFEQLAEIVAKIHGLACEEMRDRSRQRPDNGEIFGHRISITFRSSEEKQFCLTPDSIINFEPISRKLIFLNSEYLDKVMIEATNQNSLSVDFLPDGRPGKTRSKFTLSQIETLLFFLFATRGFIPERICPDLPFNLLYRVKK